MTAAVELGCPVPSMHWRHHTLPALFLAASTGHMCPGCHSQSSNLLARGAHTLPLQAKPKDRPCSDKTHTSGSLVGQLNNFSFQLQCENMPRTGLCLRSLSPEHHGSTHFKSALPLLHAGIETLKGGPGARLCILRRGTDPAMLQCHPKGHTGPGN